MSRGRSFERGFSIVGTLFWIALAAAIYFGYSLAPIFLADFNVKQAAREQVNNLMSMNSDSERATHDFLVAAAKAGVSLSDRNLTVRVDPEYQWADIGVAYNAPYKFLGSDKWHYWLFRWQIHDKR